MDILWAWEHVIHLHCFLSVYLGRSMSLCLFVCFLYLIGFIVVNAEHSQNVRSPEQETDHK